MFKAMTVAFCVLISSSVLARTWTSANGKHKSEADLVRVDGKDAVLANASGKQVRIPLKQLSLKDRRFVKAWLVQNDGKASKTNAMPAQESKIRGLLFGEPFEANHIKFENNVLIFQSEKGFVPDHSITLFLFLKENETISGRSMRIHPKSGFGAPHVSLSSRGNGKSANETVMRGYNMNLQFGRWKGDHLTARIQLSLPEHQTKLSGQFQIHRPVDPLALPTKAQRPHVVGKIHLRNIKSPNLTAGYIGHTTDGEQQSNLAGSVFDSSAGYVCCTSYKPRLTTIFMNKKRGLGFQHVQLEPGRYFFYVSWNDHCVDGNWIDIEDDSALNLTLKFDSKNAGSVEVELPSVPSKTSVALIPLEFAVDVKDPLNFARALGLQEEVTDGAAWFESVRPGNYRVVCGDLQAEANVKADEVVSVTPK